VTALAHTPAPRSALKQPPGLFLLFGVEMWERFSYYGMRAILVLFIADQARGGLGWSQASASRLFGFYGFCAYALPVAGGYIADRYTGTHRSLVIGGLVIALGHFCLATHSLAMFFLGLALVAIGTGIFKPNVSTMVGQLYRENDGRRDGGFTIFYMGVNLGAFLGQIVCGYLAESPRWGWHWGFGAAGVGMLCGLALYVRLKRRYLPGIGEIPNRTAAAARGGEAVAPLGRDERDRLLALLVIMLFTIPFWLAFEQAASSMNFFAAERTRRAVGSFTIPAAWFQSVNPGVLILASPLFASLWIRLARRGREPSTPSKMVVALVLLGTGFVFMVLGARRSDGGALVSPWWLAAAYAFHTFGELCLSPIGLSLVTKLTPLRLASLMMGLWFFSTAISELLAGQLAAITDKVAHGELFHVFGGQADFYFIFVVLSALSAVGLLACGPWLRRRMHGLDR
jgi:proton-dependent oligopeptide transporter, POT family